MAVTDYASAWGVSPKVAATMITALEKRGAYVLADADDSRTVSTGNCLYLIFNGRMFHFDASDSTTAHDGVTCCVDAGGRRFKADGFGGGLLRIFSVQSKTLTAPPGSPTIGQQWIVAVGGTGAWAGKDNYIAAWTARGWVFTVPNTYDLAMNAADTKYYNFAVSNTWVAGLPAVVLGVSTISPSALKYGKFGLSVVNQTTNTPPGSPSDGDAYIIGPSPTGAWAANARNIAIYETSAWVIYPAYNGATVYDVALSTQVKYNGSIWVTQVSGYSQVTSAFTAATENSANLTTVVFSATVAPTSAASHHPDSVTLSHTAKAASKVLEIEYNCFVRANMVSGGGAPTMTANNLQVGIQVDSAASVADWWLIPLTDPQKTNVGTGPWHQLNGKFRIVTADANAHTYTACLYLDVSLTGGPTATADLDIIRRTFTIREVA